MYTYTHARAHTHTHAHTQTHSRTGGAAAYIAAVAHGALPPAVSLQNSPEAVD